MGYIGKVKVKFPAIVGITLVSLAFICLLFGLIQLEVFLENRTSINSSAFGDWPGSDWPYFRLVWAVVGLVAFPLGLAGGIAALKRVHLPLVMAGSLAVLAWSLLMVGQIVLISQTSDPHYATTDFTFAFSMVFLAALSLTLTAISKERFT